MDSKEDLKGGFGDESLIPPGVRVRLQRFKVRANLALNQTAEAEKELALLADIDPESAATFCLRGRSHFLQGRNAEALKQLKLVPDSGPFKQLGESNEVMFNNNTGCTYHAMGKYHLACLHFQKSINKNNELLKEFPKPSTGNSSYHKLN